MWKWLFARGLRKVLPVCVFIALYGVNVFGADWPMWRCDTSRSGVAKSALANELELKWTIKLPATVMAWPKESRMQFDASYEPVVMDKGLFVGSPNDGSIAAYDTETGARKWRFYTNGPVRFAPVAHKDKVYTASDDGRLYCLDAQTGKIVWTFRAAPKTRPDMFHLGNGRLVSFWPVRGGPVLKGGRIYFASGLWPTMDIFAYALDAETGRVIWENKRLGYIDNVRVDHNLTADAGCAPQGYLAIGGNLLLIPNGRSMPAALNIKTGKLVYYRQGYRNGSWRITAMGQHIMVGMRGAVDLKTGWEMGSRWAEAGKKAPKGFDIRYDLFESPYYRYKFVSGCDAWSVRTPGISYGSRRGIFYAYSLRNSKLSTYDEKLRNHGQKPARWDPALFWKLPIKGAGKNIKSRAIMKAGKRIYGHAGKRLVAFDIPRKGATPKIAWEKEIDGTPASMLSADGKLFVVTEEGHIYCLSVGAGKAKTHAPLSIPLSPVNDIWTQKSKEILKLAGSKEGYCIVLGLGTGRLVEELLKGSALRIIAVEAQRLKADVMRDKLVAAGLYGNRAEIIVADPLKFLFPPCLASLVVSENLTVKDINDPKMADRLFNTLRPYGGVACLGAGAKAELASGWKFSRPVKNSDISTQGGFCMLRRVGPLPGAASWTHEAVDESRSYFSRDKYIKAPLGVLWYGDGNDHGFLKHKDYDYGVKPQVVGGRLFALKIRGSLLHGLDVFTGRQLWKVTVERICRYASSPSAVYAAGGNTCMVYDAETGKTLEKFKIDVGAKPEQAQNVADIRLSGNVIVLSVSLNKVEPRTRLLLEGEILVGLDRKSGKRLWIKKAQQRFSNQSISIGDGLVFCVDSMSPHKVNELKRRGENPKTLKAAILALDLSTGKKKWEYKIEYPCRKTNTAPLGIRVSDDWTSYSRDCGVVLGGRGRKYFALDGRTGKKLWDKVISGYQPVILRSRDFVHQQGHVFDIRTGNQKSKKAFFVTSHGGLRGCNYAVGNENLFFLRNISAAYIDARDGTKTRLRNIRSGCSASLIAADGVLAVPNFAVGCVCNYPLQTSFALIHMKETKGWGDPVLK